MWRIASLNPVLQLLQWQDAGRQLDLAGMHFGGFLVLGTTHAAGVVMQQSCLHEVLALHDSLHHQPGLTVR